MSKFDPKAFLIGEESKPAAFDPKVFVGDDANAIQTAEVEVSQNIPDYEKVFAADEPSYLEKSAQKKRGEVAEARKSLDEGKISRAEFELVRAGKVMGLAADVQFFPVDVALQGVPDEIKEGTAKAVGDFLNSGLLGKGIKAYQDWASDNPDSARLAESVFNIAAYVAPMKGKGNITDVKNVVKTKQSRVGKKLTAAGGRETKAKMMEFTDDLILPSESPAELTRRAGSSSVPEGLERVNPLAKDKYILNNAEKVTSATIAKIKGVSPKWHMQKNYNAIRDYNLKIGNELVTKLENIPLPARVLVSNPSKSIDEVIAKASGTDQVLAKVSEKSKEAIISKAKELLEGVSTPADLLKARKAFDNVMLDRIDSRLLTDAAAGDKHVIDMVRHTMNDVLHESVPSGVKGTLSRQSNMFDAMYNIRPKAGAQANSVLGRAWQKVSTLQAAKQALVLGGAGLLGYNAMATLTASAPFLLAGAAIAPVAYYGGKLVAKVGTIKTASNMLNALEKAAKVTKNLAERKEILALAGSLRTTLSEMTVEKEEKPND